MAWVPNSPASAHIPVRSSEASTSRPRPVVARSASAALIPATAAIAVNVSPSPLHIAADGVLWVVISCPTPVRPKKAARS
jgi:hypothetical protein